MSTWAAVVGTDVEAVVGRDPPEEAHRYMDLRNLGSPGLFLSVRCGRPEGACICAKLSMFQVRDRSWTFGHAQLN